MRPARLALFAALLASASSAVWADGYSPPLGTAGGGTPGGSSGQIQINNSGAFAGVTISGDGTISSSGVLAVTKTGGVTFGALATVTPGANVANALGIAIGSAGAPVVLGGAGGTPSAINLSNATALPAAALPALTGDITTSAGAAATTLATVNANTGSFGSSTAIPNFTVNGKGLITAAGTNAVIAPAGTLTGATLAANVLASSLTSVGTLTGGSAGAGFTVALSTATITGTLAAARLPALTGDATTSAGSAATTVGSIGGKAVTLGAGLTTTGAGATTLAFGASTQTYTFPSASATLAQLGANTFTGDQTISSSAFILSGNQSAAAWTTNGLRLKGVSGTLTDTSSSGTVAAAYTDVLGGNTIAASSATTYTEYDAVHFKAPVAGANVTFTNGFALGADSVSFGTSNPFRVTTAGAATATSLAVGGATLGSNALAVAGSILQTTASSALFRGSLGVSFGVGTSDTTMSWQAAGYFVGSSTGIFGLTNGVTGTGAPDTIFSRKAPANWQLGATDAAAPVAQTLGVQSVVAGTSNTAGQNFTINASQGTGTGGGGNINFQVAPAGTTGTAQNALVTALSIGNTQTSTFTGANNAYTATIAGGSVTGSGTNGVGLNITGTMNTSGVVDGAAIFANITNTASDPASLLTDFKLGGVARTTLTVDGKQTWFLYNGSTTGLGSISYATPGGLPGLILFTGSSFNSNRFDISYVSTSRFAMGFDGDSSNGSTFGAQSGNVFVLSSSAPIAWNSTVALTSGSVDTFLTRKAAATLQHGAADAATSVAQTISFQSIVAGTSNTSGSTAIIVGSLSTGSGASGDIDIRTGGTGAGAMVQNSSVSAILIKGATQQVNFSAPFQTAAASTGAGTATFTNSPCTGLTTEQWVPIKISGQSGTWYVPACQ